jgi:hypothetical protein
MNPEEIVALRAEVAALRRRVRLLTILVLSALAVAVVPWAARGMRPAGPRWDADEARAVQVEAQEYRLLDPDGGLRGMWSCPPAGPSMILLDERGRLLFEVRQGPKGGTLRLLDSEGRLLIERP